MKYRQNTMKIKENQEKTTKNTDNRKKMRRLLFGEENQRVLGEASLLTSQPSSQPTTQPISRSIMQIWWVHAEAHAFSFCC